MFFPISHFWCCLNSIEQQVMVQVLAYWVLHGGSIPQVDFQLIWAGTDPLNCVPRRQLFTQLYSMVLTECFDSEGNPYNCYQLGATYWASFLAFTFTPEFECDAPCLIVRFHELV